VKKHLVPVALLLVQFALAGCDSPPGGGGDDPGGPADPGANDPVSPGAELKPAVCSKTETSSFPMTPGEASLVPKDILVGTSGFNGPTWDGRVFILNQHGDNGRLGWYVQVFRPERVERDGDGHPVFTPESVSPRVLWLEHGEPPRHVHIGIYPNNDFKENPFRSNADGDPDRNGAFETYELLVMAPVIPDQIQMELRKGQIIVGNPKTRDAYVAQARFHTEFEEIKTVGGNRVRGLEPSITADGRLFVYQGHPKNNGDIGTLVYTWNPDPGAIGGWSEPKSIADMYHVDRNKDVAGIPFHERYPIAKQPLRDANLQAYAKGDLYEGAYPWVSLDGTEISHTAFVAGCAQEFPECPEERWGERALRGGFSVIGRWTDYVQRLIDGPANPDRFARNPAMPTLRTLTSGISAVGTMWQAYREVENLPLPFGAHRPSYLFIGNVRNEYSEASFEDAMDGSYVLFLRMNEFVSRQKPKWPWEKPKPDFKIYTDRTPDTSTYHHTALFKGGAAFPQEAGKGDFNAGVGGQAVYFPDQGRIEVANAPSLSDFKKGLTVELWVKRELDISGDGENRWRYLINKEKSFELAAEENGQIQATVKLKLPDGSVATRRSGGVGNLNGWTHAAFTYNPRDGKMKVYVNGGLAHEVQFEAAQIDVQVTPLIIGPGGQTQPLWPSGDPLFVIDDVKISNTVRTASEIAASAYAKRKESFAPANLPLPLGLKAAELRIPAANPYTDAIGRLGERLFHDPILSKNRDMSCATCHKPELGFTDGLARSLGAGGKLLRRNTPTILNRAFSSFQFFDGRASTLEDQALMPIENPDEMGLPRREAIDRLKADPSYVDAFRAAYNELPSALRIARALASFQRSRLIGGSRADRFENGERWALSDQELHGRRLFNGKARCISCHGGSNYSDENFHATAFTCTTDVGREESTARARDRRMFKTPTLRGVSQTAPYLHDGSLATLREVVERYNRGGTEVENRDTEIRPLGLSSEEIDALVSYLGAL
jgi:cytochrome c peroxidase